MNNKSIFLINSYTDTLQKVDKLRSLIISLKNENFKVLLITHTSTPQDIIDRCDYFIFDKENPLINDIDIQYWSFINTNRFKFYYKNKRTYIHFLAYYRLIFGGLNYIKCIDPEIEIVHSFDYDISFNNFDEIYDNEKILSSSDYNIISYRNEENNLLTYFSVKLKSVDSNKIVYNRESLLSLYKDYFTREDFPIIEKILYNDLLPKNMFIKNISTLKNTADTNTERLKTNEKNFQLVPFERNGILKFLLFNFEDTDIKIDIVVNNSKYFFYCFNKGWNLNDIDRLENIKKIKFYTDDILYLKYDFTIKDDLDMVTKYASYKDE